MERLTIAGIGVLAALPAILVLRLVLRRKPPRTIYIRAALTHLFLSGCVFGLYVWSWGDWIGPWTLVWAFLAASTAPFLALMALPELLSIGAQTSVFIGISGSTLWMIVCTRFPRKLSFFLALILGAITISVALRVEDSVQHQRITTVAEGMSATCLEIRFSFIDTVALRWPTGTFFHNLLPSHARATINGVDQIWSYREGQFITPDTPIPCRST